MARPQFPAPTFPSKNSPSKSGTGKCGSSYHITYEVSSPYKSVQKYSDVLPVAYGETSIGHGDIDESLPAVMKDSFHSALKKAITGASEILHSYDKDGYIDDTNKAVIIKMINRAVSYMNDAKRIRDWWTGTYQPDSEVPVYGWPLDEDNVRGCDEFAPAKGGVYVGGEGASVVEFTCPTIEDKAWHDADKMSYQQLLYASILNARCAQEAAATVGIHNQNKEFYDSRPGGMGLAQAPAKAVMGLASAPPPSTGDPDEQEPEPEQEQEASKPKKKKDNTLLIVGAAAAALLLFKK
jgi:hypothetical protein